MLRQSSKHNSPTASQNTEKWHGLEWTYMHKIIRCEDVFLYLYQQIVMLGVQSALSSQSSQESGDEVHLKLPVDISFHKWVNTYINLTFQVF